MITTLLKFTAIAMVSSTAITAASVKLNRIAHAKRTGEANKTIKKRDHHLSDPEDGRDIEEYLDGQKDIRHLDNIIEDEEVEEVHNESDEESETNIEDLVDDLLTEFPALLRDGRFDDSACTWEIVDGQVVRKEPMQVIREKMEKVVEKKVSITEVKEALKYRHDACLKNMLYDVIKAKYIELPDSRESRILLRDHLVQWYDKRKHKEKDIRRQDIIRFVPEAVELFFVPNPYEIAAVSIADSEEAIKRQFEAGNPGNFERLVYSIDTLTWKRWYYTPRGGSRQ